MINIRCVARTGFSMLVLILCELNHGALAEANGKVQGFPVKDVRLLDGPFKHAQDKDAEYLLSLEPDRLLAWYRKEAGLEPKGRVYGGWESQGVAGHCGGHYLSACSFMWQATGDARFRERVEYMADELAWCQNANRTGYVAAIPKGKTIFAKVAKGEISSKGFDLNGGWVPWYTIHKELAGLRDAYLLCDCKKALEVARGLADWAVETTKNLSEDQWQTMLACEHGGMNEVLADLSAITGEPKYLDIAKKFYHRAALDPLAGKRDELAGKHANTQIPKLIGCARLYELTGEERFGNASQYFWDTVTHNHSYVIGGNSDGEHFGAPGKLSDRLSDSTCETCNTYNMLKLTKKLFCRTPAPELVDFEERALWNHVLASQNPDDGMVCYYVTLRSGGQKKFLTATEDFACCTGTGMENHARYGEAIYFHDADGLYVNQFISSELNWSDKGIRVRQETDIPKSGKVRLVLDCDSPLRMALRVRHPHWVNGPVNFKVNNEIVYVSTSSKMFAVLDREWKKGDMIEFELPLALRTESMPDNPKRIAVMYGPLVLAGDLGPSDHELLIPALVTEDRPVADWVKPVPDQPLAFRTDGIGRPSDVTFTPFYSFHGRRHGVYFDTFTGDEWEAREVEIRAEEQRQKEIAARTVDELKVGEMQPERDHNLTGENTGAGDAFGRKWRHAWDGGWFSFDMKVLPGVPMELSITYWGSENGEREFDILVGGTKIAEQKLLMNKPDCFFDVVYPLPQELTLGKKKVSVKLQAQPKKMAGGIFGARMMKGDPAPSIK